MSTSGGGGGTCWHRNCSRTKSPRPVGAVSSGLLVKVRNDACPRTPARPGFRWELNPGEILRGRGNLIYRRQVGIDEAVVRRERFHEVPIVPDQVVDETLRLLRHRPRKLLAEQRVNPPLARGGKNPVEPQPFRDKFVDAVSRLRVLEHAANRLLDPLAGVKFTAWLHRREARRRESCSR